jgi:hypothetical protein
LAASSALVFLFVVEVEGSVLTSSPVRNGSVPDLRALVKSSKLVASVVEEA